MTHSLSTHPPTANRLSHAALRLTGVSGLLLIIVGLALSSVHLIQASSLPNELVTPTHSINQPPRLTTSHTLSLTSQQTPRQDLADMRFEKFDTVPETYIYRPGEVITYLLVYENLGPGVATNIVITETIPQYTRFNPTLSQPSDWEQVPGTNQYVYRLNKTLVPGTTEKGGSLILALTIDEPLSDTINRITNTATVGADQLDLIPANNTEDEIVRVQNQFDLTISKRDEVGAAVPGGTLRYTLEFANPGNFTATNIVIQETVPANTVFNAAASAPTSWSCPDGSPAGTICNYISPITLANKTAGPTLFFAVTVNDSLPDTVTEIINTATITDLATSRPDGVPENNTATVITPRPVPRVDLTLEKFDGGITIARGEVMTYFLRYFNQGNVAATGVVITETLPDHSQFIGPDSWQSVGNSGLYTYPVGALANDGTTGVISFVVRIDDNTPMEIRTLLNTAQIGDDGAASEDNPTDNFAVETTPLMAPPPLTGGPDLNIIKIDNGVIAQPGSQVTYGFIYANTGNRLATGVIISELLPPHTSFLSGSPGWEQVGTTNQYVYRLDALPVGFFNVNPLTLTVRVNDTLPLTATQLDNIALIADDGTNGEEQNPIDNVTNLATPLVQLPNPDLAIQKEGPTVATPDEIIFYRLTYFNNGGRPANGIQITEVVPPDTVFKAAASLPTQWSCPDRSPAGTICRHLVTAPLAGNGATGQANFAVQVVDGVPAGQQQLLNTATIADDGRFGADPTPADNRDTAVTTVIVPPKPQQAVYLPVLLRNYVTPIDVVVWDVVVSNEQPRTGEAVTIKVNIMNKGGEDTTTPFWIDLYLASQPINPTVNRNWEQGFDSPTQLENRVVPYGVVWKVYGIDGGEVVTLRNTAPNDPGDPNRNYSNFIPGGLKNWPQSWNGRPLNNYFHQPGRYYLYVLVDSFGEFSSPTRGNIMEENEQNNLFGPLIITVEGPALSINSSPTGKVFPTTELIEGRQPASP